MPTDESFSVLMERLHASGAIDEARLDVSALRVLRLKEWLGMNESIN